MKNRIMGIENEFEVLFFDQNGEPLIFETRSDDETDDKLKRGSLTASFLGCASKFMVGSSLQANDNDARYITTDGGMIYRDILNIEICSPECLTAREVVVHDKAMDLIANEMLAEWQRFKMTDRPVVKMYKKNTGITPGRPQTKGGLEIFPASRAFHENYCLDRNVFEKIKSSANNMEAQFLSLFLVARYLLNGCGGIVSTPHGFVFAVSPRFFCINKIAGNEATHTDRGILNLRQEQLMDEELGLDRLHIVCGDSNMTEKSTWLTLGITSLVLELLETGNWDERLRSDFTNIGGAFGDFLKKLAVDHKGETKVRLINGKVLAILEILWKYYELCEKYVRKNDLGHHQDVLREWRRVLGLLGRNWEDLVGVLGWPTLKSILEGYAEERGLALEDEEMMLVNYNFHSMDFSENIYYQAIDEFERIATEDEIKSALLTPPQTRARLRTAICEETERKKWSCACHWASVALADPLSKMSETVSLGNPYAASFDELDDRSKLIIMKLGLPI